MIFDLLLLPLYYFYVDATCDLGTFWTTCSCSPKWPKINKNL